MKTSDEHYQNELYNCLDIMNSGKEALSTDQCLFLLGLYETDQITAIKEYSDWYIDWVRA